MNPTRNETQEQTRRVVDSASPIVLKCPSCGHLLRLFYQHLGIKGNCVSCGCQIMGAEISPGRFEAVHANPEAAPAKPEPVSREKECPVETEMPDPVQPADEAPAADVVEKEANSAIEDLPNSEEIHDDEKKGKTPEPSFRAAPPFVTDNTASKQSFGQPFRAQGPSPSPFGAPSKIEDSSSERRFIPEPPRKSPQGSPFGPTASDFAPLVEKPPAPLVNPFSPRSGQPEKTLDMPSAPGPFGSPAPGGPFRSKPFGSGETATGKEETLVTGISPRSGKDAHIPKPEKVSSVDEKEESPHWGFAEALSRTEKPDLVIPDKDPTPFPDDGFENREEAIEEIEISPEPPIDITSESLPDSTPLEMTGEQETPAPDPEPIEVPGPINDVSNGETSESLSSQASSFPCPDSPPLEEVALEENVSDDEDLNFVDPPESELTEDPEASPFPTKPLSVGSDYAPATPFGSPESSHQSTFSHNQFGSPSHNAPEEEDSAGAGKEVMRSFMDDGPLPSREASNPGPALLPPNTLSQQDEAEKAANSDPINFSTIKLKSTVPSKRRLGTTEIVVILVAFAALGGIGTYIWTPLEKREELKTQLVEWLSPGTVVIRKLPFVGKNVLDAEIDAVPVEATNPSATALPLNPGSTDSPALLTND